MNKTMTDIVIDIELNGAPHRLAGDQAGDQDLQHLIATLDLSNQSLAVAINRQVVPRHRWRETLLHANDRVDVVRAIGGG